MEKFLIFSLIISIYGSIVVPYPNILRIVIWVDILSLSHKERDSHA